MYMSVATIVGRGLGSLGNLMEITHTHIFRKFQEVQVTCHKVEPFYTIVDILPTRNICLLSPVKFMTTSL